MHEDRLKSCYCRTLYKFVHLTLLVARTFLAVFKIDALVQVSFWRVLKFQRFRWRVGSNPRHQSKNIEMQYKTRIKLVHEFNMRHVSNTMWRIKNQPSNSASCSDNALVRLLVLVVGRLNWGLQVTSSSFSIRGWVLKGCFERRIFRRAKSRLKGIEHLLCEELQLLSSWFGLRYLYLGQNRSDSVISVELQNLRESTLSSSRERRTSLEMQVEQFSSVWYLSMENHANLDFALYNNLGHPKLDKL